MNANTAGDAVEVKIDKHKVINVIDAEPYGLLRIPYLGINETEFNNTFAVIDDGGNIPHSIPRYLTEDDGNYKPYSNGYLLASNPTRPYHAANKKYVDETFVTMDKRTGLGSDTVYIRDDATGQTQYRFIRTHGTPGTNWHGEVAGYTARGTIIASDPVEAQDLVTLNYFNNNVHTTFKYKHVITVSLNKLSTSSLPYDTGKIYITLYSSNNLKVDSYADFTTIVGNTFTENCNGYVVTASASKQILRFSSGYLTIIGATDGAAQEIAISNFSTTWTDIVTTM